jgi:hypothetical protein
LVGADLPDRVRFLPQELSKKVLDINARQTGETEKKTVHMERAKGEGCARAHFFLKKLFEPKLL